MTGRARGAPPLVARAHGKINLGLEVLGRRDDGYHELRTILQTIELCDELRFWPAGEGIRLTASDSSLPTGAENLVHRAASLLAEHLERAPDVAIDLVKRIPAGKGLGGGSADAAMTLLALDRLWNAGLSPAELHRLGSEIGMDVPFFLYGGTALAVGRGEEIYPLALDVDYAIVLILPDFSIRTSDAYANLRLTKGQSRLKLQHFAWSNPCVRNGFSELVNDLERATGEHTISIREYKKLLLERGASGAMMSGSGSAVFGIFENQNAARRAADSLSGLGIRALATRTLASTAYRRNRLASEA